MKKFQMGKYYTYVWKGLNQWQQKIDGIILADSNSNAEKQAQKLGINLTYFKKKPLILLSRAAGKPIKIIDIVFIMRQLTTMLAAGIPLVQTLEILADGAEKVKLRALMLTIRDDVSSGKTFSEALFYYPYYFNNLICALVNAGERSGTLDQMLNQIALYLERNEILKNRVKKALYYPITVLSFALLISIGMLVFLVPRFEVVYKSFGAKLPAFTQVIINLSHNLKNSWWIYVLFIIAFIFLFKQLKQRYTKFAFFLDFIKIKIILFGKLIQQSIIARTSLTLSITLSAGIPLINALERIADVANNQLYKIAFLRAQEQVAKGESMAKALHETRLFPVIVTQMIAVGEKSGSMDTMLRSVYEHYNDQVNTTVEGLSTLIEPLLIMVLAIVIGSFVIAMYLPIFNLGAAIK